MRCQRKSSITYTYTYYATLSLLVLLPDPPSQSASHLSDPWACHPSLHHFHPCFFLFSDWFILHSPTLPQSPCTPSLHPLLPLGMWIHLLPAACCPHECLCVLVKNRSIYISGVSDVFDGRNWPIIAMVQYTQIWFHSKMWHFNVLPCMWTHVAWKQWDF